jgi:hypothetical protein
MVWLCTGLWHGAAWYYAVWGLLFGLIMIVSEELAPLNKKIHKKIGAASSPFWTAFRIIRTYCILGLVRTLECYRGVNLSLSMLRSLFTERNWALLFSDKLGLSAADWGAVILGTVILLMPGLFPVKKWFESRPPVLRSVLTAAAVLVILVFGAFGIGYDASDFIYGQF